MNGKIDLLCAASCKYFACLMCFFVVTVSKPNNFTRISTINENGGRYKLSKICSDDNQVCVCFFIYNFCSNEI